MFWSTLVLFSRTKIFRLCTHFHSVVLCSGAFNGALLTMAKYQSLATDIPMNFLPWQSRWKEPFIPLAIQTRKLSFVPFSMPSIRSFQSSRPWISCVTPFVAFAMKFARNRTPFSIFCCPAANTPRLPFVARITTRFQRVERPVVPCTRTPLFVRQANRCGLLD